MAAFGMGLTVIKMKIFMMKIFTDEATDCTHIKGTNYYLQGFLKHCKYIEKEVNRYIIRDPEIIA